MTCLPSIPHALSSNKHWHLLLVGEDYAHIYDKNLAVEMLPECELAALTP